MYAFKGKCNRTHKITTRLSLLKMKYGSYSYIMGQSISHLDSVSSNNTLGPNCHLSKSFWSDHIAPIFTCQIKYEYHFFSTVQNSIDKIVYSSILNIVKPYKVLLGEELDFRFRYAHRCLQEHKCIIYKIYMKKYCNYIPNLLCF